MFIIKLVMNAPAKVVAFLKNYNRLLILFIVLFALPFSLVFLRSTQQYVNRAAEVPSGSISDDASPTGLPYKSIFNISLNSEEAEPLVPVVGNVDNTPELEVVVATSNRVQVVNHEGYLIKELERERATSQGAAARIENIELPAIAPSNASCQDCEKYIAYGEYSNYSDWGKIHLYNQGYENQYQRSLGAARLNQNLVVEDLDGNNEYECIIFNSLWDWGRSRGYPSFEILTNKLNTVTDDDVSLMYQSIDNTLPETPNILAGDLDGGVDKEVVISNGWPANRGTRLGTGGMYGAIYVYKSGSGYLPGWPKIITNHTKGNVLLANIDDDSNLEIITDTRETTSSEVYVQAYKVDGTKITDYATGTSKRVYLSVADFNNDGQAEILIDSENNLRIIDAQGTIVASGNNSFRRAPSAEVEISILPNNPANITGNLFYETGIADTVIGDIDSDGYKEFIKYGNSDNEPAYHFYRVEGKTIREDVYPPIPTLKQTDANETIVHHAAIADINQDGLTDLVFLSYLDRKTSTLHAYSLELAMGYLDWPQHLHDERHTGAFDSEGYIPPLTEYKTCVDMTCVNVPGNKADDCKFDADCYQRYCTPDNTCEIRPDTLDAPDLCTENADCETTCAYTVLPFDPIMGGVYRQARISCEDSSKVLYPTYRTYRATKFGRIAYYREEWEEIARERICCPE